MPEWISQLIGPACAAVAVYAGIRADLAAMGARIALAESAINRAHERIDLLRGEGRWQG